MTEPKILSVCWLPREKLKTRPDRVILQDEILRDENGEKFDEDDSDNALDESDLGNVPEVSAEKKSRRPDLSEEDSKIWDKFGLDDYDDEEEELPFRIGALLDQGDNEDGYDPTAGEDSEEEEDITLKKEDHILLAGSDAQDGTASIEVRIFNKNEEYYVRNDISLSGPPLCLCYIHTEIGQELEDDEKTDEDEYANNFVAVGSITNEIQIWDLDVLDSPGPAYTLTGHRKGSSVLSISWDGHKSLISGGTDGRLLLWSLDLGTKVALGSPDEAATVNQCLFASKNRIVCGKNTGKSSIFDNHSGKWTCVKEIDLGTEIEQIASSNNFFALGTDNGEISLISHRSLEMVVRWRAFQPTQPITALQFRGDDFLFSSGHLAGSELIIWNISKHTKDGASDQIPYAQYSRKRHKNSGRAFCAVMCPESDSDLVLIGGESGGPQVLKLTQQSKKEILDDSDSEDSDEEGEEDKEAMEKLEEDEWETDTGSSEGEEIPEEENLAQEKHL